MEEGEAFVSGLTAENATALLELAEKEGLDPSVVRTTEDGFVVPEGLAKKFKPPEGTEVKFSDDPPPKKTKE